RMTSITNAPTQLMWIADADPQPSAPRPCLEREYLGEPLNVAHSTRAPRIPPTTWATQLLAASMDEIRLATSIPRVTAGFTCAPEIPPKAYARPASTSPKASAVATTPAALELPASLNPNISVAVPHPR